MENIHLNHEELETFRSKLYSLDGEDGWLDQGTGYPLILKEEGKNILKFANEENGDIIYQIELNNDLQFDQQEEKIFTWYSETTKTENALSFQNEAAAEALWQKINDILASQKKYFPPAPEEEDAVSVGSENGTIFDDYCLIVPHEDKLAKFESDLVKLTKNLNNKNTIGYLLCDQKFYLENLFNIFHKAELKQDQEKLNLLFKIFRHLIAMAHYDVFVTLMSDEYFMDVFGILEYDPKHAETDTQVEHRKYFEEHENFEPVANISDVSTKKTLQSNLRLIYLRDYALGHYLDERILQFISAIIQSNYIDIIKYIQTSKEVLTSLFDLLRGQNLEALKMLHEICVVMKNLEVDKIGIFGNFEQYGLFEILEELMVSNDRKSTMATETGGEQIDVQRDLRTILEILTLSLIQAPDLVRSYCLSEDQKTLKYPFLSFIVENATRHKDPVIQHMLCENIKHLIDVNENLDDNTLQKLFYQEYLERILNIFDERSEFEHIENGKNMAMEILVFCSRQQMNEFRNYLIPLDIVNRVFQSFPYKDKFITLMIVQFYKLLMKINEPQINQTLIKPLKSIISYYVDKCRNKWNLIQSSILEVFQIILQEEMIALLTPLIKENYKKFLDQEEYKELGENLREKYSKLTNGDIELSLEERKQSEHSFTNYSRKPSGSFTLELLSPSGNSGPQDSMKKPTSSSPKHGDKHSIDKDLKRTSSNLAKTVDYDTEMDFNNETRFKDPNFLIEDLHVKKRKLDEVNSIKILNKATSNSNSN